MKQDNEFTKALGEWLSTPPEERDLAQGALMLLKLNNNKLMYRNLSANLRPNASFIEHNIKQYYNFRLQSLTREEVKEMEVIVEKIVKSHFSFQAEGAEDSTLSPSATSVSTSAPAPEASASDFRKGKRADHDSLPEEIQALYVENLSIMQKMRENHTRLRLLSAKDAPCPASDRYPFLKELIRLDKEYHKNWAVYDSYQPGMPLDDVPIVEDAREESLKAVRQINLLKGRYKKAPNEDTKQKILALLAKVANPTEKLLADLQQLGIIEKE